MATNRELAEQIKTNLNELIDRRGNTRLIPLLVGIQEFLDELKDLEMMIKALNHIDDDDDYDEPPHVCYMGHKDCWDNHTSERLADEADWEQERLNG